MPQQRRPNLRPERSLMRIFRISILALVTSAVAFATSMPAFADTPRAGKSTKGSPARPGKTAEKSAVNPGDGTVTGTLTLNGKKFPIKYIYARKREAWPSDAK